MSEGGPPESGTAVPTTRALAALAGVVAAVATGVSLAASVVGLCGAAALAAGGWRRSPTLVSAGAAALGSGVVVGGLHGAGTGAVVVGTVAALLAWSLAQAALDRGPAYAPARTVDGELALAGGVTVLAGGTAAVALAGTWLAGALRSPAALVALLVGALVVTAGLRA